MSPKPIVGSGSTVTLRVRLKGLASATKTLADGLRVTYHYAWRGGPRLNGEPGTPDFIKSYNEAVASRRIDDKRTLSAAIDMYLDSSEFNQELGDRTKLDYKRLAERARVKFGTMPLVAVEDKRARGLFKGWRDEIATKSLRQADYQWVVLARILSVAKDRGLIAVNQCERGGRLYKSDRAEIIWQAADIEAFCVVASEELQFALLLALWTGQRLGDLLKLTWSAYDGSHIRLRQSKGGRRVAIPVSKVLKPRLDRLKEECRSTTHILCTSRGHRPWTLNGFESSWAKTYARSEKARDLHFHDLRGTAVTRLAWSGCTVPEIASITGHSLKDVEAILEAHYLSGRFQLAEQAIEKLDAAYGA